MQSPIHQDAILFVFPSEEIKAWLWQYRCTNISPVGNRRFESDKV